MLLRLMLMIMMMTTLIGTNIDGHQLNLCCCSRSKQFNQKARVSLRCFVNTLLLLLLLLQNLYSAQIQASSSQRRVMYRPTPSVKDL